MVLGDEEVVLVGLLLEAEGVDELVVLLKVMRVTKEENDFIDVVFVSDGGAECSHESITVLDEISINYAFDD